MTQTKELECKCCGSNFMCSDKSRYYQKELCRFCLSFEIKIKQDTKKRIRVFLENWLKEDIEDAPRDEDLLIRFDKEFPEEKE